MSVATMGLILTFLLFVFCLLIGLLLLVIGIEAYHRCSETARLINLIPGPKHAPVIGNALDLIDNPVGIFNKLRRWSAQYYPVHKLWSTNVFYAVHLCAPEDMQTVLSNMKHHQKSSIYLLLESWLRTGLLTSNCKKWQRRRKILTPTFHFNILKRYIGIFNKHALSFVADLQSDANKDINVLEHIHKSSLHTIAEAAMGTELKGDSSEKQYRNAIARVGEITVRRLLRPWLYFRITNCFSSHYFEEILLLRYLKNFTKNVINKREEIFNECDVAHAQLDESDDGFHGRKKQKLAMLDLLLLAKNRGEISYDGICEEVDTFMFEGHDTISMAMQFMLMLLANNGDCQEKLYEEVTAVLDDDREPTYQDLTEMTYMELVIKESLRLYPSVPLISRLAGEELTTSSGHRVPAGSILILNIYDTHRLEHIYPEADKFVPERFTAEHCQERHPFAFLPFSAGPRNCIGQKYAMLNMKCKLAAIVKHFVLLPVDTPESVVLKADLVLRTENAVRIKIKSRK